MISPELKSSMNTSMVFSTMFENLVIVHLWNVPGNPNGNLLNVNVPYGYMKWFSLSLQVL